ncbi:MAG: Glycosyl transferase group 1 [Parcubacteria group bacterium GW2011_GWA1_36_12]|nr:MAG: Glycosyl transferase group 1 [Parcubacteria group bacterium GW2011_GWA1_36_12]
MKITFVTESFLPFGGGGAEWSTFYLAKSLKSFGHDVSVITPNLGSKNNEILDGVKILRFPFYLKLKSKNNIPGIFAFTNPLWLIWSAIFYLKYLKEENPEVIHVQGKYSIPPIIIANLFFNKPIVATIRDYIVVCNYGFCLMNKEKVCSLKEYFLSDFKNYWKIYVKNKNIISFSLNFYFALWGRFARNYLKFFTNRVDRLITLSEKQKEILNKNGVTKPITTIQSIFKFSYPTKTTTQNNVLFVGRLTFGKGVKLLVEAIPKISSKLPQLRFLFIGEGFLKSELLKISKKNRRVKVLGHVSHTKLQYLLKAGILTVIPSIWPDPLPRVILESIANGTPIVATRSGGIPEIIKDGTYGYLAEKDSDDLTQKIIKGVKNNQRLRNNIKRDFSQLKRKYSFDIAKKHEIIYNNFLLTK